VRRYINRTPKGTSLHEKTSYDVLLVKIGPPVRPVHVTYFEIKKRQRKKPYIGKQAIRPDHSRRLIEIPFGMAGGLPALVISLKFHHHRLSSYRAVRGQNLANQPYSQICTLPQADNHACTPPLSIFTGRMPFLPPNQQHQSTGGSR